jgi:hypothetical protein
VTRRIYEEIMSFHHSLRLFATAIALLSAGQAMALDRTVRIHNDTGLTLYRFYSTNTGASRWGRDVMGATTLAPGASMKLNFDNADGYCQFDFRAIFEDGTELTRQGVNVCETSDYYYQP